MYYHVIVPVPLDKSLTYAVLEPVKKGQIVEVPWRNKRVFGLVVECDAVPPEGVTLKEATPLPLVLSERTVSFIQGVAHYTLTSLGWVWRMVLGGVDLHKVITQKTQENIKPTHEPILKSLSVDQEEAVTGHASAEFSREELRSRGSRCRVLAMPTARPALRSPSPS